MSAPLPEARLLPDCPTDGVTALSYLSDTSLLASSSWDGGLRVHDASKMQLMAQKAMESGPLLSLATATDGSSVYTGGLDGSVRSYDIQSSAMDVIGKHKSTEPKFAACSQLNVWNESTIVSAGWNSKVHVWDVRAKQCSETVELPGKAFSMDIHDWKLVVATSGRRTCLVDLRKPEIVLDRESSLKFQLRVVRFFSDGNSIAVGSVEGRVGVEYFEELGWEAKGKKYAFKCHRDDKTVYPVNCIEFNPRYGTFATGGCDGTVVTWDGMNKKKLTILPTFPTSIAAMAFNHDGNELAIAASYTFEDGEREHPRDEIYVREMLDSECMPKSK